MEKIEQIAEEFVQNPIFAQAKKDNQLKYKYLEKIEQKKQEENPVAGEAVPETQKVMSDFQECFCEMSKTRLNRNMLTVKFRNSDCFQEFVR